MSVWKYAIGIQAEFHKPSDKMFYRRTALARAPESVACAKAYSWARVWETDGIVGVLASTPSALWPPSWAWASVFSLFSSRQWVRICEDAIATQCQLLLELNKEVLSLWDSIAFPLFAKRVSTEVSLPLPLPLGASGSLFPQYYNSGVREAVRSMRGALMMQALDHYLSGPFVTPGLLTKS